MTIASFITLTLGFIASFILAELSLGILSLFLPPRFDQFSVGMTIIFILVGIFLGAIFGAIVYGRKAIGIFSLTNRLVSIATGLFINAAISGHPIITWLESIFTLFNDINIIFLITITLLGFGLGLGNGFYRVFKSTGD